MKTKPSIIEVAQLAGVSKSTVSRVVSDSGGSVSPKAQAAVLEAIATLGYSRNTFAAALRTSRTYMCLLMVPDIANPFWSEIARAIQDRLEDEGYSVVVANTDWSETREATYLDLARSGRFDGIIINSVTDDLPGFRELGIPVVLIGERAETHELDTVGSQTYEGTRLALDFLYERGHRRIAIATSEIGSELLLSRRYKAYESFLADKGLPLDPALVFSVRLSEEGGVDLVHRVLAIENWRDTVSAIFCGNDILAIGALNEFRASGFEPGKDISIIGMDDIHASSLTWPALTTIRKPRIRLGRAAAELLLARLAAPDKPHEKRLFPGELVIRESVADWSDS